MEGRYKTGAHTKHRLLFHIVFIPKYRKRVLRGQLARRLREMIEEGCRMNDWELKELEVLSDHVHMLIQLNPKDSIAEVMQRIKGASSRVIRQEFPELEEFLWGDSLWGDGYFAETVGRVSETTIVRYLRNQQNKQQVRTHGL